MSTYIEHRQSRLLLSVVGYGPQLYDPAEPRRADPRITPRKVTLAMRRPTGPVRMVRLYDASKVGLAVVSRDRPCLGEVVSLRLHEGNTPFERFRVVHVNEIDAGFRVGMVLDT